MASERFRHFFLTANKGAEAFDNFPMLVEQSGASFYAYILHNQDAAEEHFHAVLSFENAHTFGPVLKAFPGVHVEACRDVQKAVKYLLHRTPASVADGKHLYGLEEVVASSNAIVTSYLAQVDVEPFEVPKIPEYIADGDCNTPYTFARRFGVEGFAKCWRLFRQCLDTMHLDESLLADVEAVEEARRPQVPAFFTDPEEED